MCFGFSKLLKTLNRYNRMVRSKFPVDTRIPHAPGDALSPNLYFFVITTAAPLGRRSLPSQERSRPISHTDFGVIQSRQSTAPAALIRPAPQECREICFYDPQ